MSRTSAGLVAGSLLLADLFLHKPISDLADWLVARYGFHVFNRDILVALAVPCVLLVAALMARLGRRLRQPRLAFALVALAVMTLLAHRFLMVANIEVVHFPQFALPAAVFLAGGMSALPAWLAATFCGVIDEVYQHLVIYAGVPGTYLDYNDMLFNAIGAAWAIVLFAPMPHGAVAPPRRSPRRWRLSALAGALLFVAAVALDPPQFSPFLRRAMTGCWYRVLSLPEALVAAALLAGIVTLPFRTAAAAVTEPEALPVAADCVPELDRSPPSRAPGR